MGSRVDEEANAKEKPEEESPLSPGPPAVASRPPGQRRRARTRRDVPSCSFDEALVVPNALAQLGLDQKVRRLRVFEFLRRDPDSGPSRQLVSNAKKYGLIEGSSVSEHLELTSIGRTAVNPEARPEERLKARFQLAIEHVPPFKLLYERLRGGKLPDLSVMRDILTEQGIEADMTYQYVDCFVENAKQLGLLRMISGAERILRIEHALEEVQTKQKGAAIREPTPIEGAGVAEPSADRPISDIAGIPAEPSGPGIDWEHLCFYICPIGDPESEQRQHSDLFLSALVEPAVAELGLRVVRADQIGKPGMITAQVIEHVVRAGLVVADLSFHNPNVFYELSLRHACGLPTVQIIRRCDPIPFDLDQVRTIQIDTTSIYTLVPRLESYKAEIANQARRALSDPRGAGNPLTVFCPGLRVKLPNQ